PGEPKNGDRHAGERGDDRRAHLRIEGDAQLETDIESRSEVSFQVGAKDADLPADEPVARLHNARAKVGASRPATRLDALEVIERACATTASFDAEDELDCF